MNDLISRQAAIETVRKAQSIGQAHRMLVQLPSAQPDVPDTNVGDMISRQAAISEIMEDIKDRSLHDDPATPEDYAEGYDEGIRNAAAIVLRVPSVQPSVSKTEIVEDCISRAAVVYAIEGVDWYHMTDSGEMVHGANSAEHQAWYKAEDIYKAIEGVPSAQPGWIPCSRELPKNEGKYYVTQHRYGAYDSNMTGTYVCNTDYIFYSMRHSRWLKDMNCKVVAWMPLPKPYREGGQDNGLD